MVIQYLSKWVVEAMCEGWDAQHDALRRYDPVMEAIAVFWLVFLCP